MVLFNLELEDKRVHTINKGIKLKMNVTAGLKFELALWDVVI